jgi:hypothetical protein
MKSISRAFACRQRSATKPVEPTTVWARRLVANPARYGATPHHAEIVADLLSQLEVAR